MRPAQALNKTKHYVKNVMRPLLEPQIRRNVSLVTKPSPIAPTVSEANKQPPPAVAVLLVSSSRQMINDA